MIHHEKNTLFTILNNNKMLRFFLYAKQIICLFWNRDWSNRIIWKREKTFSSYPKKKLIKKNSQNICSWFVFHYLFFVNREKEKSWWIISIVLKGDIHCYAEVVKIKKTMLNVLREHYFRISFDYKPFMLLYIFRLYALVILKIRFNSMHCSEHFFLGFIPNFKVMLGFVHSPTICWIWNKFVMNRLSICMFSERRNP